MIHLYVGNGKGKSTAAAGLIIRLLNNGSRILLVCFLKDGTSGELLWLKDHSTIKTLYQPDLKKFVKDLEVTEYETTKTIQRSLLSEALDSADQYDAIFLDEFTDIIDLGIITLLEAVEAVKKLSKNRELVMTGHQPVNDLIEMADYFTEFVQHKHPYTKGIKARKGIEF